MIKGSSKKIKIHIKVKGSASKNFTFKVKDKNILKVTKKKTKIVIRAKKVGTTKITIKTKAKNRKGKKLKKTIKVTVKNKKNSSAKNKEPSTNNAVTTKPSTNNTVTTKPSTNNTVTTKPSTDNTVSTDDKTVVSKIIIDNPDIEVGKETEVVMTGIIENGSEKSYTIVDDQSNTVGYIWDNGYEPDDVAGDGIYMGNISLYSETKHEVNYYVLLDGKKTQEYATAYYYNPITDADNLEYNNFISGLDLITEEYDDKTEESAKQLYHNVLSYLEENKNSGVVKEYSVDKATIKIELSSGIQVIYEFPVYEDTKSSGNSTQIYANEETVSSGQSERKTIATFEPYSDLQNPYFDRAAQVVADSKYDYLFQSNLDGGYASIERMKHLNDYSIIIWCGHGGLDSSLGALVFSGTKITDANNKKYAADLNYGRIVNNYSGGQYGVSSEFFERYYQKDDFNNTLIYFGTCHSLDDERLANVLISKGVSAILGYKNSVSSSYDEKMVQTVFEELSANKSSPVTIAQALSTAKNKHGANDGVKRKSWWEWLFGIFDDDDDPPAELCIKGNENYTLSDDNIPSTSISTKYDIVLTWGADPCDMDSHMFGSMYLPELNFFHVYYNNDEGYDYYGNLVCSLDDDDTSGYGPETITINTVRNGTYYYYVHKFDGDGSVNTSNSVVKVYQDGVLKSTYNVAENSGEGDYWNVFAIKNGEFIENNTITEEPDTSY